jgi:hypothetical protein
MYCGSADEGWSQGRGKEIAKGRPDARELTAGEQRTRRCTGEDAISDDRSDRGCRHAVAGAKIAAAVGTGMMPARTGPAGRVVHGHVAVVRVLAVRSAVGCAGRRGGEQARCGHAVRHRSGHERSDQQACQEKQAQRSTTRSDSHAQHGPMDNALVLHRQRAGRTPRTPPALRATRTARLRESCDGRERAGW